MKINDMRLLHRRFYVQHQHGSLKSASVIPTVGDNVLFTTAGMHPLVPYLLGEKLHPKGNQLTSSQIVIRTTDIDEIGDTTHLTSFEMMGNWSIGEYGKKETLAMSFDFITNPKYVGLPVEHMWVSVFEGDEEVGPDHEAAEFWKALGIPESRIAYLPKSENWWAVGENGLCGPCSEMFIDTTPHLPVQTGSKLGDDPLNRFVEVGNNVFMSYVRENGVLKKLDKGNIDVGMGLERMLCIKLGYASVFDLDLYQQAFNLFEQNVGSNDLNVDDKTESMRIIADHLKTTMCIMADAECVTYPSNKGAGYILRRLIRRLAFHSSKLNLNEDCLMDVLDIYADDYNAEYPEFKDKLSDVKKVLQGELTKFHKVMKTGNRILNKELAQLSGKAFPPETAFMLLERHGLPIETTKDILTDRGYTLNLDKVNALLKDHQDVSRVVK